MNLVDVLNTIDNANTGQSDLISITDRLPQNNLSLMDNAANRPINLGNDLSRSSVVPSRMEQKLRDLRNVRIRIIEQPAHKALRFRYLCEGRSAGSIPGQNSTNGKRTFPTIEIEGYRGEVTVVVSCVTKDPPFRQHPHNLVGKDGCQHGVFSVRAKGDPPQVVLSNLGIQCVRRKDIKAALDLREERKVDPFKC